MPELTRRRRHNCWHIYYGDVTSGRLPSASAIRTIPTPGNGAAASIPARIRAKHRSDTAATFDDAAPISSARGRCFYQTAPRPIFRHGATREIGTERKYALRDAGKRLEPPNYGPGKPCSRFMKCPCGEVFDMHGPEAVLMHVPHVTTAQRASLPP